MAAFIAHILRTGSRSFRMGFTPCPPELSPAGIARTEQFMAQNGDVNPLLLLEGITWNEALDIQTFTLLYRPRSQSPHFCWFASLHIIDRKAIHTIS